MRSMSNSLLALIAISFLVSCGGGGNGDGNSTPTSPKDALRKLSSTDSAHFDQWKNRLTKGCDATQAFPESADSAGDAGSTNGIDGHVFFGLTANSLLLQETNGDFALLGEPESMPGTETSNVHREYQENGNSNYILDVKMQRSGSQCEVYLYGQKVYATSIWAQVPIEMAWSSTGTQVQVEPTFIETPTRRRFCGFKSQSLL